MADEQTPSLENRVQLLYEAVISETSFRAAEDRASTSAKRTTAMTEAEFRRRITAEQRARNDAYKIQGQQTKDEQQELRARVQLQEKQRREAALIKKAMLTDEKASQDAVNKVHKQAVNERLKQERYETQAREALQRQRSAAIVRNAKEQERAASLVAKGPRRPQMNQEMVALGFGLTSLGVPGSRLIGGAAISSGFGGAAGLTGTMFAGTAIAGVGALLLVLKSLKDAMADTKAELNYALAIRTIGGEFGQSLINAEQFHKNLNLTRAESYTVAAALAKAASVIKVGPNDIAAITTRAQAGGQTPEEMAKILDAISKGNKEAFEEQTGLRANIVINEYARSLGKLPDELAEVTKAQILWNTYILQSGEYADLAARRITGAESTWQRYKNRAADISSGYGRALIATIRDAGVAPNKRNTDDYYPLLRALGFNPPKTTSERMPVSEKMPGLDGNMGGAEKNRQRVLDELMEEAGLKGEKGLRGLKIDRSGQTDADRLGSLIAFRREFQGLTSDLDATDPRIRKVSGSIEQEFSKSVGQAYSQTEALRKSLTGMTGEFAALQLPGQQNPFVKLYSDGAEAADKAYEKFRILGKESVDQYTKMQQASTHAQIFQMQVGTTMKAVSLEFEAANLAKPFMELTGEMKRSLSILQSEVGAAVAVPKLLATASAIDMFSRFQRPRNNEKAFGLFGQSELGAVSVQQKQFDRLIKLQREYGGSSGRGGEEADHILNQELIRLFGSMSPQLQAQALRVPGGQYAKAFGGAYKGEAAYAENQVTLTIQRAQVGRQAAAEATQKLKQLQSMKPDVYGAVDPNRLRAEIIAITGALPREELTPELLKGRIGALKEEAVFQRKSQQAAIDAVEQAKEMRKMLEAKLDQMLGAINDRQESVLLRVLDDSNMARVRTLGPAMDGNKAQVHN